MQKAQTYAMYTPASVIFQEGQHGKYALILGDSQAANSKPILSEYSIKTVITIGAEAAPKKKNTNVKYHLFKLRDQKDQEIAEHFDEITEIIENGRKNGGVLINCFHGVSRSSSFVIAYVMRKVRLEFSQAKEFVKKKRSCISPNEGFLKQLVQYQKNIKPFQEKEEQKQENSKVKVKNSKLESKQR